MQFITRLFIALFLLIGFIACADNGDKFIGKWQPITERDSSEILVIAKHGKKAFRMYNQQTPENILLFIYDKDRDQLSVDTGQGIIDIRYKEKEGHIIMAPRMPRRRDERVEFRRIKY